MAKKQDVYMPLVIGDWLKGTRGMKAEVRGVYINLLLYQWDNGFIPSDMETLALIDPEVGKVWVFLKDKFVELEAGKLHNLKNDEVKAYWAKQSNNGSKGGRPPKENPTVNPKHNPDNNPNHNHHNDLDLDSDLVIDSEVKGVQGEISEQEIQSAFGEQYMEGLKLSRAYPGIDLDDQLLKFKVKVRGSPGDCRSHDTAGLRKAFNYQLRTVKPEKTNGLAKVIDDQRKVNALIEAKYGNRQTG